MSESADIYWHMLYDPETNLPVLVRYELKQGQKIMYSEAYNLDGFRYMGVISALLVKPMDLPKNMDDNVPQRELRDRISNLEQDLGFALNILHFIITDPKTPISEPLRTKLWQMLDALFKQQNER